MPISKEEVREMFALIQQNIARLQACPGPHVFVPINREARTGNKWSCTRCNGDIDASAKHWYDQGLKHASGAPGIPPAR